MRRRRQRESERQKKRASFLCTSKHVLRKGTDTRRLPLPAEEKAEAEREAEAEATGAEATEAEGEGEAGEGGLFPVDNKTCITKRHRHEASTSSHR